MDIGMPVADVNRCTHSSDTLQVMQVSYVSLNNKTPIWLFIDAANDDETLLISEFVPVFDELCKSHYNNHARMYQFSVI